MGRKNTTPNEEQAALLRQSGVDPEECLVVCDLDHAVVVLNLFTGTHLIVER